MNGRVARLAVGIFLLFLGAARSSWAEQPYEVTKVELRLPGGTVEAERFEGREAKERPVILVLHGAGGTLLDGPEMRRVARALAADGNAVYLVHYFERTGTIFAFLGTMKRHFRDWLGVVQESIPAIQERRGTKRPVGIYGYSLGGFLALAVASDNPRVGAVVEQAGGVWDGKMELIKKMPPVLMVHGRKDRRVPFAKYARPLESLLRKRAPHVATLFFADEGHVFTQPAMEKVRPAATQFFRRALR